MHAIILAGGLGTRLRSAVPDLPKAMAPVGGRPFLHYLLMQLKQSGFDEAVLCVGYRSDEIRSHFGDGTPLGMRLRYSVEHEQLGTAGALALAGPMLEGDRWLVMNGDSYLGIDLADLVVVDAASDVLATIALRRLDDPTRYGRVELMGDGTVVGFWEKEPTVEAHERGLYMNAGVYVIGRDLVESIPADGPVSLEREILPALVGARLRGQVFEAPFIDIGVPDDYARVATDAAILGSAPHRT